MSTHETVLAWEFLYSTLSGDSTLMNEITSGEVYRALAPVGAVPPYIVFIFQSGADDVLFQGVRGFTDMLFQVKAVGPAKNTQPLADASARLDTLLTKVTDVAVTGGTIKACFRSQPFQLDELVNGEMWTNLGGLYRLIVRSS
jgi:hypothetical protein